MSNRIWNQKVSELAARQVSNLVRETLDHFGALGLALSLRAPGGEENVLTAVFPRHAMPAADAAAALELLEESYRSVFSSPVIADGRAFGEVRVYFDSTRFRGIFPLELTRYLGERIGGLLMAPQSQKTERRVA
jgi:hypothetical protein